MTTYHFWYSRQQEIASYEHFALAMEFGFMSTLDIPHQTRCKISLAGEEVEIVYNLCAEKRDTYEKGTNNCEVGWTDLQYLGEGQISSIGHSMCAAEVAARMQELGAVVPSILVRSR